MRTIVLLLMLMPAYACLNDRTTPEQEAEFRAAYKDLPPAPPVEGTQSIISGAGGVAIGVAVALFGLAIGARILRDRV